MPDMIKTSALRTLLAATALAAVLTACGRPAEADLLTSARAHLERHEPVSAMLLLKTLLQAHPQSGEARLMLGQAYASQGSMLAAEAEMRRALDAGLDRLRVAPALAQVMLEQGRPQDVIKQFADVEGDDTAAMAALKAQLAAAYLIDKQLDLAQVAVDRALALVPEQRDALRLQARLLAARGDQAGAVAEAAALGRRWGEDPLVWVLKGDLATASGDLPEAVADYQQALRLRPAMPFTHVALISLHLGRNDLDAARQQWSAMNHALPGLPKDRSAAGNPLTVYTEAVLALRGGDALRTRELCGLLLRNNADHVRTLVLAGQAEMQLKSWRSAQNLLWRAIVASARSPEPRRLVARVHLAIGQPDRALAALAPLVLRGSTDREALMLAAQSHQLAGEQRAASEMFARAAALMPDDPAVRTVVSVARLKNSDEREVFGELQAIARTDTGDSADMALYSLMVQRGDWRGAGRAVDALAVKQAQLPLPPFLRGQLAALQQDKAAARQHWQAALALDPGYVPAVEQLAGLDLAEGQAAAAVARFDALLQRDPANARGWMLLAAMKVQGGAQPRDVTPLLERAVKVDPTDPLPRVALIDHLAALGEKRQAMSLSQSAIATLPDAPELIEAQGRLFMATGEYEQAAASFSRLASMSQRSAKAYLRWAEAQLAAGNLTSANDTVRRAIELEPDALPVQRAAIALAMREQRPAKALEIARKVQRQRPRDASGFLFEGDIEAGRKAWPAAAAAYTAALERPNPGTAAMRLHLTWINAGQADKAARFALAWLKDHPGDVDLRFQLGDVALVHGDWAAAETHYRAVLDRRPRHAMAMNNLAEALLRQRKTGATALAEQAVLAAPEDPRPLDTLATALAGEGHFDRAIELQSRAVSLAAAPNPYRLNLARIQLQAGNKPAARQELERLSALGDAFAGHREVQGLLKSAAR